MFQATNQILNPVLVSSLFSQALQHSSSLGGDADCSRPGVETILTASLFFLRSFILLSNMVISCYFGLLGVDLYFIYVY